MWSSFSLCFWLRADLPHAPALILHSAAVIMHFTALYVRGRRVLFLGFGPPLALPSSTSFRATPPLNDFALDAFSTFIREHAFSVTFLPPFGRVTHMLLLPQYSLFCEPSCSFSLECCTYEVRGHTALHAPRFLLLLSHVSCHSTAPPPGALPSATSTDHYLSAPCSTVLTHSRSPAVPGPVGSPLCSPPLSHPKTPPPARTVAPLYHPITTHHTRFITCPPRFHLVLRFLYAASPTTATFVMPHHEPHPASSFRVLPGHQPAPLRPHF